jgi:hypothetical protein
MPVVRFEWDPQKAETNPAKHGVAFEEAASVFRDPFALTLYDQDHSSDEDRWVSLGLSERGRLLVVNHTVVDESPELMRVRIISSRLPTREELRQYQERKP